MHNPRVGLSFPCIPGLVWVGRAAFAQAVIAGRIAPQCVISPVSRRARPRSTSVSARGGIARTTCPSSPGIFRDQSAPIVRSGFDGERELAMARSVPRRAEREPKLKSVCQKLIDDGAKAVRELNGQTEALDFDCKGKKTPENGSLEKEDR
jgi:hypothetical protein